jgi:hypothetical protein
MTMKVAQIKEAIDKLTLSERAELLKSLHGWADDAWDEEIGRDFDDGKFDAIIKDIESDMRAGRLEDGP